jgi:16S rRNA (guanine(1405)-N(7))-methyltransferase
MSNAPSSTDEIERLAAAIQAGQRYRPLQPELVRRIAAQELGKGRSFKQALKAARGKLHQAGGAYLPAGIDYEPWLAELQRLPRSLDNPAVKDFCRRMLALHASTRERLPTLEDFYARTLAPLAPLHSLLDLACGLNPLALPWLPLAEGAEVFACDIYTDLVAFLNRFFAHFRLRGRAEVLDLTQSLPAQPAQVALLLKTIPCLEQLDKTVAPRLLDGIRAEHLLVSFPGKSLGGRARGMPQTYAAHFAALAAGRPWSIERIEFANELVFRVRKERGG